MSQSGTSGRADESILEDLDEQIIAMVLRRTELARRYQSERRMEGLPTRDLARENAMLRRYVSRLGRYGAEVAGPVLSLSQLSAQVPAG
jgi:chorismate mutase